MSSKTDRKSVGQRIQELRKKNNETQKELAKIINTTPNSISKLENGDMGLTFDNMLLIAEHYNVSLDYICKGEGGIDLLDTLNKFIRYQYQKINHDGTKKYRLIPHISINKSLYTCMKQISLAKNNPDMPESIKELWIRQAIEDFNNEKNSDNYEDFISFIALENTILTSNSNIINLIEEHIIE